MPAFRTDTNYQILFHTIVTMSLLSLESNEKTILPQDMARIIIARDLRLLCSASLPIPTDAGGINRLREFRNVNEALRETKNMLAYYRFKMYKRKRDGKIVPYGFGLYIQDEKEQIRQLQEALRDEVDLYDGKITGLMDKKTKNAYNQFFKNAKDGDYEPETREYINILYLHTQINLQKPRPPLAIRLRVSEQDHPYFEVVRVGYNGQLIVRNCEDENDKDYFGKTSYGVPNNQEFLEALVRGGGIVVAFNGGLAGPGLERIWADDGIFDGRQDAKKLKVERVYNIDSEDGKKFAREGCVCIGKDEKGNEIRVSAPELTLGLQLDAETLQKKFKTTARLALWSLKNLGISVIDSRDSR